MLRYKTSANSSTLSFFTTEQQILLLKDQALFADSLVARIRALKDLIKHGINAIPVIEETLNSLPATDVEFRKFCRNAIHEIKRNEPARLSES